MKKRKITNIGEKYHRLTVISEAFKKPTNSKKRKFKYFIRCKCECGTEKEILESSVVRGNSKSCGCLQKEKAAKKCYKHGMSQSLTYQRWAGMKDRCNNKNYNQYKDYGGRGIKYDPKWETYEGFYNDMGDCKGLSLERLDNNGNYNKENCVWANTITQGRNTRTSSHNKITKELLRDAISDLEASVLTHKEIAAKYDISTSLVANISFANKTYKTIKEIKENE